MGNKKKNQKIDTVREPTDERFGAIKIAKDAIHRFGMVAKDVEKKGKFYTVRIANKKGKVISSVTISPFLHSVELEAAAARITAIVTEAINAGCQDPAARTGNDETSL